MQNDDVYPNDSSYFLPTEPVEQTKERNQEKAKILAAAAVIEDIIAHFQERIDYRDTLEAIKPDLAKSPELHQKVCEVNDMLKLALIEEKNLLEDLLQTHR